MKSIFSIILLSLMSWGPVKAQKKESGKQVHVKIEQEKNGETIITDTVFNSKSDADAFLNSRGMDVPEPPAPPSPPAPPAPPVPPAAKSPGKPRAPKSPPTEEEKIIRKKVTVSTSGEKESEEELAFAFEMSDLDEDIEKEVKRVMRYAMPGFEMDFNNDGEDVHKKVIMRMQENSGNNYRLDFNLDEPGSARITVQGKDGKMLYEESLEGVEGSYHRDFNLEKYAGATLQLNVQSGKSKQTRKLIL